MMQTLNDKPYNGRKLRINGAQLRQGKTSRNNFPNAYSPDQVRAIPFASPALS